MKLMPSVDIVDFDDNFIHDDDFMHDDFEQIYDISFAFGLQEYH